MIAIVGGLLVSRYVGLHAEQQAAQHRVDDLRRRYALTYSRVDRLRHDLEVQRIEDLLHASPVFTALTRGDGVDRVFAITGADRSRFDRDAVTARMQTLSKEIDAALDTLQGIVPAGQEWPPLWESFRSEHAHLEVGNDHVWKWVYEQVCAEHFRVLLSRQPTGLRTLANNKWNDRKRERGEVDPQKDPALLRRLEEEIRTEEAGLTVLEQEATLAEEARDMSRQPEGFSLALWVLSILALFGVAVPVVIMAFEVTRLDAWMRVSVVALFFAGVALLLRFLFAYASFLKDGGRRALPRTVFGLLWKERTPYSTSTGETEMTT